MSRLFRAVGVIVLCFTASLLSAQSFSGLARVDPANSHMRDTAAGADLVLSLSQGVPFRLFTLEGPDRLVLDFREVDWTGMTKADLGPGQKVADVRFGGFRPGWSRMVVDLAVPMVLSSSDMRIDAETGQARLFVKLGETSREQFSERSHPPSDPTWGVPETKPAPPRPGDDTIVVVLDPGHGGIDPGAVRGEQVEKQLMLTFARELRDALLRVDGIKVVMTREDDSFVSLERRVAIAHQAGGDIFISLHADALSEGHAHGATVHTLSDKASDAASALLAERHDRTDILAGVDLTGTDDVVADVLLDLARIETQPRAQRLAHALVDGLDSAGAPLNRRPFRSASFSVLKAADIPSVLLELGFLSSKRDLANLSDPEWRKRMAAGIRDAIQAWLIEDAATKPLVRQ